MGVSGAYLFYPSRICILQVDGFCLRIVIPFLIFQQNSKLKRCITTLGHFPSCSNLILIIVANVSTKDLIIKMQTYRHCIFCGTIQIPRLGQVFLSSFGQCVKTNTVDISSEFFQQIHWSSHHSNTPTRKLILHLLEM